MEPILSTILGWLKLTPSVLWSLVVVIGLVLWGPNLLVTGLGLEPFIEECVFVALLLALAPTGMFGACEPGDDDTSGCLQY
jgi:hypothetical protein